MSWDVAYVLPNLELPETDDDSPGRWPTGIDLGSQFLLLVRSSDPRVLARRASDPAVDLLLSLFRTRRLEPQDPAVLVVADDTPDRIKYDAAAFVAFRNSIAIAVIMAARSAWLRRQSALSPTWSDTFEFSPVQLSKHRSVVSLSPAEAALIRTDGVAFTPSAHLSPETRLLQVDSYLYRSLGSLWVSHFERGRQDRYGSTLFRSLQIAFDACSISARNQGSIHDYGLTVTKWVNAIEILAWPRNEWASFAEVRSLLGGFPLNRDLAVRRYRATLKKKTHRLNALERAYSYLYLARNHFVHGNPVSSDLLLTKSRKRRVPIIGLASIVYRAALIAYLNQRYPYEIASLQDLEERVGDMFAKFDLQDCLAAAFGRSTSSGSVV